MTNRATKSQNLDLKLHCLVRQQESLHLIWVEPGTFWMGNNEADIAFDPWGGDQPKFEVTISQGYWLAQYPVTQSVWNCIMGTNPSHFHSDGARRPVESVSWHDAVDFTRRLSSLFIHGLPVGYLFSLPTEAQWEYACRAGTDSWHYLGNATDAVDQIAWHRDNSGSVPHDVGLKTPNAWGFYDMLGNVGEWCLDCLTGYPSEPAIDWRCIQGGVENERIVRGGAYRGNVRGGDLRCGGRTSASADSIRPWIGLRLCISPSFVD